MDRVHMYNDLLCTRCSRRSLVHPRRNGVVTAGPRTHCPRTHCHRCILRKNKNIYLYRGTVMRMAEEPPEEHD